MRLNAKRTIYRSSVKIDFPLTLIDKFWYYIECLKNDPFETLFKLL